MFASKKPYSSVTVTVERLTGEEHPENDLSGIPDLVEVVNLQDTGPSEAARAIRKKLKYGNVHRQLRALTLLDGLIQNAGARFQRSFADEPLLERLRFCGTAALSDPLVKKKCAELFRSWAADYKNVRGMERVATLYKELPRRKKAVTQERSKAIKETENPFDDSDDDGPAAGAPSGTGPAASVPQSFKPKTGKSKKRKPFIMNDEKEQMKADIGQALLVATELTRHLQTLNREQRRISENAVANSQFEKCKQLRRKIMRYIYLVESEEWLHHLLQANDELVTALITFEQLDRSIDADSDSDDEVAEQAHRYRMATEKAKGKEPASPSSPGVPVAAMAALRFSPSPPPQPPRPTAPPRPSAMSKPSQLAKARQGASSDMDDEDSEEEDENDPFADRNAVVNPK